VLVGRRTEKELAQVSSGELLFFLFLIYFLISNSCSNSISNLNLIPLSGFKFQIPLLKYKPNVNIYSSVYNIIV
jgi:hypothetical protein